MPRDPRTFITLHDGMPEHHKIEALSDKAFRTLIDLWCWCSQHHRRRRARIRMAQTHNSPSARRATAEDGRAATGRGLHARLPRTPTVQGRDRRAAEQAVTGRVARRQEVRSDTSARRPDRHRKGSKCLSKCSSKCSSKTQAKRKQNPSRVRDRYLRLAFRCLENRLRLPIHSSSYVPRARHGQTERPPTSHPTHTTPTHGWSSTMTTPTPTTEAPTPTLEGDQSGPLR